MKMRKGPPPGVALPLHEAVALLIQNQAAFMSNMAEVYRRFDKMDREMEELKATMRYFGEVLSRLPEAIRRQIGFKSRR